MLKQQPIFTPFPVIQTDRLTLRKLKEDDAHQIFQLRTLTEVNEFLDRPPCSNFQEAQAFIQKINEGIGRDEWIYWGLSFHTLPSLIGTICLWNFSEDRSRAELGMEMLPNYQGKGLMTESLLAIIEYARNSLNLAHLDGYTHEQNKASRALMEKLDFVKISSKTEESQYLGGLRTLVIYQLEL